MAITAALFRAQLEAIAKKISDGYTDSEIMHDLKIKRATFYNYKAKIFNMYGNLASRKTEQSLEFEAEILKDRYIRLYRNLELRIYDKTEPLENVAYATEIASNIATNILRLEAEGLRARQQRGLRLLEQKTVRYLGNTIPNPRPTGLQESDTTTEILPTPTAATESDSDAADTSAATGSTEETVF